MLAHPGASGVAFKVLPPRIVRDGHRPSSRRNQAGTAGRARGHSASPRRRDQSRPGIASLAQGAAPVPGRSSAGSSRSEGSRLGRHIRGNGAPGRRTPQAVRRHDPHTVAHLTARELPGQFIEVLAAIIFVATTGCTRGFRPSLSWVLPAEMPTSRGQYVRVRQDAHLGTRSVWVHRAQTRVFAPSRRSMRVRAAALAVLRGCEMLTLGNVCPIFTHRSRTDETRCLSGVPPVPASRSGQGKP